MNHAKIQLVQKARKRFKQIYPCRAYNSFRESFTVNKDRIIFWFNTEDNSTHALASNIVDVCDDDRGTGVIA